MDSTSELEEAHKYSHFPALAQPSYQTCLSHISSIDRQAYIHCWVFGRRHRSAGKVVGGAFAVEDGESPKIAMMLDHNTFRCDGDDYS